MLDLFFWQRLLYCRCIHIFIDYYWCRIISAILSVTKVIQDDFDTYICTLKGSLEKWLNNQLVGCQLSSHDCDHYVLIFPINLSQWPRSPPLGRVLWRNDTKLSFHVTSIRPRVSTLNTHNYKWFYKYKLMFTILPS